MTDVCDDAFFHAFVWKLLEKDVKLLLADECSSVQPDAVERLAGREFVKRQYKMAQLTAHSAVRVTRPSAMGESQLAGMQGYALMYDATMAVARELIEDERCRSSAASAAPAGHASEALVKK